MNIKRGDIYYADLSPVVGSEQGGIRPVLIVQNDVGNRYSPTAPPISRSKRRAAGCRRTASSCSNRYAPSISAG